MPDWLRYVRRQFDLPALDGASSQERIEEVARQLEDCYREALAGGLSEEEAVAHAKSQIRDWDSFASEMIRVEAVRRPPARETARAQGGKFYMLSNLRQDLVYGLRLMRRGPAFTAVVVLTLALGVGATAAIFSAVHAVLLRPFPYADPERLAVVSISWPEGRFWLSEEEIVLLREQSTLFEGFAVLDEAGTTLLGEGGPKWLNIGLVSANVFDLLGVRPALGRTFKHEEELPGGPQAAILSHELWQSRFQEDPEIVGQLLEFGGGTQVEVVGVMPPGFEVLLPRHLNFHPQVDLWYPHRVDYRTVRRGRNLVGLGRVKAGVTWARAQQELDRIAGDYFPAESTNTYRAFPLHADTVAEIRPALTTLLVATAFVLLIACVNVANLLLARGTSRRKEIAVRSAMGASRGRIVRQSLTESCLFAAVGGGAGILLAWAGSRLLSSYLPARLPRLEEIQLNATVLVAAFALSLAVGLLFGLAPALRSGAADLSHSLREGGRTDKRNGVAGRFTRQTLIVGEIALSLMLLIAGSLAVRSFINLQHADIGYTPANILTFSLSAPSSQYETGEEMTAFFRKVQERVAALPGVASVGGNSVLPFGTSLWQSGFTFYDPAGSDSGATQVRQVLVRPITPGYLETLQADVLGRSFTFFDTGDSLKVAIVDETVAESVWPGENPIGKRIAPGGNPDNPTYFTIVGVTDNLRITELRGQPRSQVYLPYSQYQTRGLSFFVRTWTDPMSALERIRTVVAEVDPRVPLHDISRLEDRIAEVMAPERVTSLLMALFAAIGLALATIGVYGVIADSVHQRTHEIGLRFALGAQRHSIYGIVFAQGMKLTLIGLVLGLVGAAALARTLESQLYGVTASDLPTYVAVSVCLIGVALAACYVPARRATQVDPLESLRCE